VKFGVSLLNYRPGRVGGIETYIRKLIEAFSAAGQDHDICFITGPDVGAQLPETARRHDIALSSSALIGWRCAEAFTPFKARKIARAIDAAGYDAILFPQQSIFPIGIETPAVMTAVDVQHLHRPEHYSLFDTRFRRAIYPPSLKRSRKIIAISEATKRDLVTLCGVDEQKIDVIHLGYDAVPIPETAIERVVQGPYLYYPAATFPHKGHANLLRCFARLREQGGGGSFQLVLSGMQTPLWKELSKQVVALGLQDVVQHLGFVPYEQVVSLYQYAEAIVFPSEFEGFGMPVLEAVRYGKPVFCSDLPVFEELGVPGANRLDFSNPDVLVGITDRLQPTQLLKAPTSWADCAERTLQAMQDTVECRGNREEV